MIDLIDAKDVQVQVIGRKLWINVDGVCKLRIGTVGCLSLDLDGAATSIATIGDETENDNPDSWEKR